MDQKVLHFIEMQREKGFAYIDIRHSLLKAGHDKTFVDDHIKEYKKKHSDLKYVVVSVIVLLLLLGAIGYILWWGVDHTQRGWDLYSEGRYEEAIVEFEKGIQKDEKDIRAYEGLGWSHYELREFDYAKQFFSLGLSSEESASIYCGMGWTYWQNQEYENATKFFNQALKIDQNYAPAYSGLGRTYSRLGDFESAKNQFLAAIEIEPDDTHINNGLGWIYLVLKEYSEAETVFKKSIELEQKSCTGYMGLALLEVRRNQTIIAREYYNKGLTISNICDEAHLVEKELFNS